MGTADRWADLAITTWSAGWNYGPGWEGQLLAPYGVSDDPDRTRYYRLLWDLGPEHRMTSSLTFANPAYPFGKCDLEMVDEVRFRPDLYGGTAGYYDRYRPRYPAGLMRRLVDEARVTGGGRLLDLACGTGQVALGLASYFEEVWAVDQEADMVRVGRSAAARIGAANIRWLNRPVEALTAPLESFELVRWATPFIACPGS